MLDTHFITIMTNMAGPTVQRDDDLKRVKNALMWGPRAANEVEANANILNANGNGTG